MPRARSITPPSSAVALAEEEAPKGRNTIAQGNALGNRPTTNPSPEGAAQEFNTDKSPQGWRETTFGELVRSVSINDKKLPAKQYAESGKFPVVDQGQKFIGGYSDDEHRVISDELPLIVFGDHTRIFKYLDRAFVPGADGIKVLKPIGVDAKWLFHIAHALDFPDKGYALHFQHLKQATVFVPPLPEQRRIVARLEELFSRLDAGVAALRHARAQLQRYRQSVLAAGVNGQLTQAWREQQPDTEPAEELLKRILKQRREQWGGRGKYKEPLGYGGENPFATPPSWALTNFEQVSRRVTVGHVGSMKDEYTESGVPFLRGQNVRANRFDANGLKFVSREFHLSLSKSLIRGGDIAVTRSGDVGIACVIPEELGEANCSDLVLTKGPVLINPNFTAYYMNSLGRRLVQQGKVDVAITHFNTQAVAAMPLPLPPIAEQHQIVAEVEARTTAIDHLEAELDRQITRSNRLRQSTLASAFTGKF